MRVVIKINISILGYGHIGKELVFGINHYNAANLEDQININHILVKNTLKYSEKLNQFTSDENDIINDSSDLVIDLLNNIDYSLDLLPKITDQKKSLIIVGKIFLSENIKFLNEITFKNDVKFLIGSCVSSDFPIKISLNNPYFDGNEYLNERGNSSTEISAAIMEDIFYYYK